jgi:uncharacterized protein HemX
MNPSHWPIVLIEGVLVLGGALLFGWWQLRSIDRDRQEAARQRADEALRSRKDNQVKEEEKESKGS